MWGSLEMQDPKIRHLGTIAQFCLAISSQLRHISTIGKKLVKQQCLPHMFSQYGELWPTSGWDLLASFRHPYKFQQVSRLGTVTARHSSSRREPNFAALNRGRHLYSAGRPSRWAWPTFLVRLRLLLRFPREVLRRACLCVYLLASKNHMFKLHEIFRRLHANCDRGYRSCSDDSAGNTLFTSGFVNNVVFSYN